MRLTFLTFVVVVAAATAAASALASGTPTVTPQPIADSQLHALTTTVGGGATVLPTTRTVPHWWGSTFDPQDGLTYGYNIVGADPYHCSGAACDVTVDVDITPVILRLDGLIFSGSDVLQATLDSPEFAPNDYGSTLYATGPTDTSSRGPGGVLSQGDAGNRLQLQDATMRAQFDRIGASGYHLRLRPNVLPPVTIDVPQSQGVLLQSGRGAVFAAVAYQWWGPQIHNLETKADPTHLALYLTDDVFTYFGNLRQFGCCAIGFHGARSVGSITGGSANSNGNASVQTFAWVTWLSPGIFARPDGGMFWYLQDMAVLSHEVAEWADDPFATNIVQWYPSVLGAPELGCSSLLEAGDDVEDAAFTVGTNTFRQGPNPNGTQSADGYYHPQDELFLPWFMRGAPNLVSEPTQTPSANVGRYTFMGELDTFPDLTGPAPTC